MSDSPGNPGGAGEQPQRRHQEYEDPHFHDDEDYELRGDEHTTGKSRPPSRRKPSRRPPPPRRRYED
jgi:hypothetical protein